jgi:hypothetical protein
LRKQSKIVQIFSSLCLTIIILSACKSSTGTTQSTYDDPFAYCKAVGTIDAPDGRYNGPAAPQPVIDGLIRQKVLATEASPEFQKNLAWRCVDGKVWACHFGANIPCQEKADRSKTPNSGMEEFCMENPSTDVIPAAASGRATVYEWKCADGKPEVVEQVFQVDQQGFLADFWYELAP